MPCKKTPWPRRQTTSTSDSETKSKKSERFIVSDANAFEKSCENVPLEVQRCPKKLLQRLNFKLEHMVLELDV